jgi:hypothetical protein
MGGAASSFVTRSLTPTAMAAVAMSAAAMPATIKTMRVGSDGRSSSFCGCLYGFTPEA